MIRGQAASRTWCDARRPRPVAQRTTLYNNESATPNPPELPRMHTSPDRPPGSTRPASGRYRSPGAGEGAVVAAPSSLVLKTSAIRQTRRPMKPLAVDRTAGHCGPSFRSAGETAQQCRLGAAGGTRRTRRRRGASILRGGPSRRVYREPRSRGSRWSRIASAKRFAESTVVTNASEGKMARYGWTRMKDVTCPESMFPQDGVSG